MSIDSILVIDPGNVKDKNFYQKVSSFMRVQGIDANVRYFQRGLPTEDDLSSASLVLLFPGEGLLAYRTAIKENTSATVIEVVSCPVSQRRSISRYHELESTLANQFGTPGDIRYAIPSGRGKAHAQVKVNGIWQPACGQQAHGGVSFDAYQLNPPASDDLCGICKRSTDIASSKVSGFNPDFATKPSAQAIMWMHGLGFIIPGDYLSAAKKQYQSTGTTVPNNSPIKDNGLLVKNTSANNNNNRYVTPFQPKQISLF